MTDQINLNTFIISVACLCAGWVLRDLRSRLSKVERRSMGALTGLFYLILKDPNAPPEARHAIEQAMKES